MNQQAIARLQSLLESEKQEDYNLGYNCGCRWAEEFASPRQLKRLEEIEDLYDILDDVDSPFSQYGTTEIFYFWINPDSEGDRIGAKDFWEKHGPDYITSTDAVLGFYKGAISIWWRVLEVIYEPKSN